MLNHFLLFPFPCIKITMLSLKESLWGISNFISHYCMSLPYISTCVPSTDVGIVWSTSPMEGTYVEMYGRDIDVTILRPLHTILRPLHTHVVESYDTSSQKFSSKQLL